MAMDLQQGLAGSFSGLGGGFSAVREDQAAAVGREHRSSFSGKSQRRGNSKRVPSPVAATLFWVYLRKNSIAFTSTAFGII